jgi:hypothetical protein
MKRLLQLCSAAVVLALFYAATAGWSIGVVLSSLLTAATLVFACDGMRAKTRIEGIAILAWLFWGLSYVSNLIEALFFHVIPAVDAQRSVASGFVLALLIAFILEWLMPERDREQAHFCVKSAPRLWLRIPVLAFLFFVFYFAAGLAIHPWIAAFYQNRPLPSLGQLFLLQFFRGLLDISCIFPLLRRWIESRQRAAWMSACVFTVLCGWGPLLLPNQFLPTPIRFAHGVEMGGSGIAFGIVAAMLLLKPKRRTPGENISSGSDDLDIATTA